MRVCVLQVVTLRPLCARHRAKVCKGAACCAFEHSEKPVGTVRPTWDSKTTLFECKRNPGIYSFFQPVDAVSDAIAADVSESIAVAPAAATAAGAGVVRTPPPSTPSAITSTASVTTAAVSGTGMASLPARKQVAQGSKKRAPAAIDAAAVEVAALAEKLRPHSAVPVVDLREASPSKPKRVRRE